MVAAVAVHGCKSVRFCDAVCQKSAWKKHKEACKTVQKSGQNDVQEACRKSATCRRIWGLDPHAHCVKQARLPQGVPPGQSRCLLHFVRESQAPASGNANASCGSDNSSTPAPLESARYAQEFEGRACPVVELSVKGQALGLCAFQSLRTYFQPQRQHAVIIRGLPVLPKAMQKWTVQYLRDHLGATTQYHTFRSESDKNTFTYFLKDPLHYEMSAHACSPPNESLRITSREFCQRHEQEVESPSSTPDRLYFQAPMFVWREDGTPEVAKVEPPMQQDLQSLNFNLISQLGKLGQLGRLARSTLFCSGRDALSPVHYDQAQNLYFQIRGRKRFLLFPPDVGHCFYPYPIVHPMDLRARIDLSRPDYQAFPQLRDALGRGIVADLRPGDVLFLPTHWWHQVQSLEDTNISLNFWFHDEGPQGKAGLADAERVLFPLSPAGEVELARQIELFLADLCGPGGVENFLKWVHRGTFTDEEMEETRRLAERAGSTASAAMEAAEDLRERSAPEHESWNQVACYILRRTLELVGMEGAHRLLDLMLHPKRWAGLAKRPGHA